MEKTVQELSPDTEQKTKYKRKGKSTSEYKFQYLT